MSSFAVVPDTAARPAPGRHAGPEPVPVSPAAGLPAAAPVLAPSALPERVVMPKSEFAAGSPGWMPRGACRGEDPELFFPVIAAGPALEQVFAAKAVCFRCAVRAPCLSYTLATGQAGIWGGTTQEERHAMRRSSGFPAHKQIGGAGSASAPTHHRSNPAGP
jgi:WhiB family transcriptional regulator, redox-sensing transcriptional regulator